MVSPADVTALVQQHQLAGYWECSSLLGCSDHAQVLDAAVTQMRRVYDREVSELKKKKEAEKTSFCAIM
jgi:hypothetical protein